MNQHIYHIMDQLFQPNLSFNPSGLGQARFSLTNCAIAIVPDASPFSVRRLSKALNRAWNIIGNFTVEGKIDCFFLISFSNLEDRDFVTSNGPWSINNSLLLIDQWAPNLLLRELQVLCFPIWIQFWNVPLEYHTSMNAAILGDAIGYCL